MGMKPRKTSHQFERRPYAAVCSQLRIARVNEANDDIVLVFDGDLHVRGDLRIDSDVEPINKAAGLLIRGDLRVDGFLLNWEDDENSPFLQVDGDVQAKAFATGSAQVDIRGVLAADCVLGVYNHGSVKARAIRSELVATEHAIDEQTAKSGYWYTGWGGRVRYFERGTEDASRACAVTGVFQKRLLVDRQQQLDFRKALSWLAEGREILQRPFVTIEEQATALIRKQLPSAERIKELSFKFKDLPDLPKQLEQFTNLEHLDLQFNELQTVPEVIRKLTKLRTLNLSANHISELPEWIGELGELRELNLYSNWGLTQLPETIGRLTNLTSLILRQTSIQSLPDTLAACERLASIDLSNTAYPDSTGSFMTRLPDVLTRLPELQTLVFSGSLISRLPDHGFVSTKLQTVRAAKTPLVDADPMHPKIVPHADNAIWPAEHVCKFWLKIPRYDRRSKRFEVERFAKRVPAIATILDAATAPLETISTRVRTELDKLVAKLNSQGDVDFVVREWFAAGLEAAADLPVKRPLADWLRETFAELARYETPCWPHAAIHLVTAKDIERFQKVGPPYSEFYGKRYGKEVPFCSAREALVVANRSFPKNTDVVLWEFDARELAKDPTALNAAFRNSAMLYITDFGFAFPFRYWDPKPWRD